MQTGNSPRPAFLPPEKLPSEPDWRFYRRTKSPSASDYVFYRREKSLSASDQNFSAGKKCRSGPESDLFSRVQRHQKAEGKSIRGRESITKRQAVYFPGKMPPRPDVRRTRKNPAAPCLAKPRTNRCSSFASSTWPKREDYSSSYWYKCPRIREWEKLQRRWFH